MKKYDHIVIGAGVAGITIATTLAESNKNVLLVEEGPLCSIEKLPSNMLESFKSVWQGSGPIRTISKSNPVTILAGKIVGGSSVMSGMILHRLPEEVYFNFINHFPALRKNFPLTAIRENESYFLKSLNSRESLSKAEIEYSSYFKKNSNYNPMIRSIKNCKNIGLCMLGCPNNQKTTFLDYLNDKKRNNLVVLPNTKVVKIIFSRKKATGVILKTGITENIEITSDKGIILASGVLNSAHTLKKSNIKNRNIGELFTCNISGAGFAVYKDRREKFEGPPMGLESFQKLSDGSIFKLAGQFTPKSIALSRLTDTYRVSSLIKSSNYSVWSSLMSCSGSGKLYSLPFFNQQIIRYGLNGTDKKRLIESVKIMREECLKNGAEEFISLLSHKPLDELADSDKINVGTSHIFGGCIWGETDRNSVVDEELKLHNYENLYVCDASIFPEPLGVNPILTIAAFSRQLANNILQNEI